MNHHSRNAARRGVTLTEIVVISVILLVVAAILFPVFAPRRGGHHQMSGASNQKQIGIGVLSYLQDFDEKFPPAAGWTVVNGKTYRTNWAVDVPLTDGSGLVIPGIVQSYIKNSDIFHDPFLPRDARLTYMYNDLVANVRQSDIAVVERTVLTMDGPNVLVNVGHAYEPNGTPVDAIVNAQGTCDAGRGTFVNDEAAMRHSGGANYGFTDGHVKWYKPGAIYFPSRSSTSRHHRDPQTGVPLGPDPIGGMTWNGKTWSGTFHLR